MYFIIVITTHNSVKTTLAMLQILSNGISTLDTLLPETYSITQPLPQFVRCSLIEACEKKTIRNCFRHAGIIYDEVQTEIECSKATTEDDDLSLNACGE